MGRTPKNRKISRKVGTFKTERRLLMTAIIGLIGFAGWIWLQAHPEHNPAAPLDLRDPIGMATATKLAALKDNVEECRTVLDRSEVAYAVLPATGEGACARPDRTQLTDIALAPDTPPTTCSVAAALEMWRLKTVAPAAKEILGSDVVRIEHLGAYNCRRMRGNGSNSWSQHATGNAIDIAAFVLADGRRISVLGDWDGDPEKAQFLRTVRDGACAVFASTLSPDFNAAHADHFHFDQTPRWAGVCR